ncbi:hypothetical protein BaRGS_00027998 [Batillaria attramentaria]|uniref:Fibronectin type III-like domain-containing protein n=1 Tax=Batillaria attramentaria TaxID=370345 RepID=A0ABD0K1K3_9CAEN
MGPLRVSLFSFLVCLHVPLSAALNRDPRYKPKVPNVDRDLLHKPKAPNADDYPFRNVSLSWDERVADLVGRLTLEEIQEQMGRGGAGENGGPAPAIKRLDIGPYQWNQECLRGDVGAQGNATAFPQALGLAAAFSPDLIFRVAEVTAVEVRGKHNDFVKQGIFTDHTGASCFSPVINIMRDSRWGRNQETYGEDPYLSGIYADRFIRGLQGNDTRYVRASGGCKHFDVHGGPDSIPVSRFSFNAEVSEADWRTTFLPAFRRCVEAGTYSLMCSYNRINGVPACANSELLTDVLRGEWNFTGYIVSDEGAIENIIYLHHYLNNTVDTVAACVNAGCNLELSGNLAKPVYFSLVDAVNAGKLTQAKVQEMVSPLFYTRMRLGEFDPPEMNPYSRLSSADVETDDHKALAVEAAMKSFVLLKNDGVLPLNHTAKYGTIAIVGPMADDASQLSGDYAPRPPPADVITPLAGLRSIASTVQYAAGCSETACTSYNSSDVIKAVTGTEITIVALGTGQSVEAEGHDRPDIELPGQQKQLLMDVINNTPEKVPIILLLFNAGPVNISFADQDPRVSAIMECFFPAQATGDALRHVLLNDVDGAVPAGRLPYTWPLLDTQMPPMVNYSMAGRTYRYFDGPPLYPFGYGLSYTTFRYTAMTHTAFVTAGEPLKGQVWVDNVGHYDADEVVQVYIRWRDIPLPEGTPKIQLAWFDRISMKAGQSNLQVSFEVEARSMAQWKNGGWFIEEGFMDLFVGGQQPHQKRAAPNDVITAEFKIVGSKYLGRY